MVASVAPIDRCSTATIDTCGSQIKDNKRLPSHNAFILLAIDVFIGTIIGITSEKNDG